MSADPRPGRGREPRQAAAYSVGTATGDFRLPFAGGLLSWRAGQQVVAHPELRRALEEAHMPVRFETED